MQTRVSQSQPWGFYRRNGHRLLCSDGIIRAAEFSPTPDTFFSVPACVRVNGKWASGYMTCEESRSGDRVYTFRHHTCHDDKLPAWPEHASDAMLILLDKAK